MGSWETLQRAEEQKLRPPGMSGGLPWAGTGSALWGLSGIVAWSRPGAGLGAVLLDEVRGGATGASPRSTAGKATEEGSPSGGERSPEEAERCVQGSCGVREVGAGRARFSWRQDTQPGGQTKREPRARIRVQGW